MTDEEVLQRVHKVNMQMLIQLIELSKRYDAPFYLAYGGLLGAVRHKGFIPWDNDVDVLITRENYEKLYAHREELSEELEFVSPEFYGDQKYFDCVPRIQYRGAYIKMNEEACRFYMGRNNRIGLDFFFIDKTYKDWRGVLQRYELAFFYGLMNGYRLKKLETSAAYDEMRVPYVILSCIGRLFPLPWMRRRVQKIAVRFNNRENAPYYFNSNDTLQSLRLLFPVGAFGTPAYLPFERISVPVPWDCDAILKLCFGNYMELPPEEERIPHWGPIFINSDNFVFDNVLINERKS